MMCHFRDIVTLVLTGSLVCLLHGCVSDHDCEVIHESNTTQPNTTTTTTTLTATTTTVATTENTTEAWVDLFNGKDMTGWIPGTNEQSWSVQENLLVADGPSSHLFYVGDYNGGTFTDFELKVDVMTTPGSNSGIYFHTAPVSDSPEQGFDNPTKGYEAQIDNSGVDPRKTGSLYSIMDVSSSPVGDSEWFEYHIIVKGKAIELKVNGQTTMEYTEPSNPSRNYDKWAPDRLLSSGTFALQCHGSEGRVYFKNVRVKVPMPKPEGKFVDLFNGNDMSGWAAGNNQQSWSVESGSLIADGLASHLFYVGDYNGGSFTNFELRLDVMTTPGSNSGVFFHTQLTSNNPRKGYEAQIENTGGDSRKSGSLYSVKDNSVSPVRDNEWFEYRITVNGRAIAFKLNGESVMTYIQPDNPSRPYNQWAPDRLLSSGTFALQCHDPHSRVYFKRIQVKVL